MKNVTKLVVVTLFFILLGTITAEAQVRVSIGINLPVFPQLVIVPNYPVYYAPSVRANYFFYDGLYWVFNVDDGYWYSSSWYKDRKSTRLNSSHIQKSRMPSSA